MTQEEKELLLKDLCERLPYMDTWVQWNGERYVMMSIGFGRVTLLSSPFMSFTAGCPLIEEVKPYLRKMSSMTEEEKEYVKNRWCYEDWNDMADLFNHYKIEAGDADSFVDWLNAHHFDYRGLIEKGLALEDTKGMYNTKTE